MKKSHFAEAMKVKPSAITKAVSVGNVAVDPETKRIDLLHHKTRAYVASRMGAIRASNWYKKQGLDGDEAPKRPETKEKKTSGRKNDAKPTQKGGKRVAFHGDSDLGDQMEDNARANENLTITKVDADTRRILAQTAKINMEMAVLVGRMILKEKVSSFFARLAATVSNLVLPMGQRVAPRICAKLGIDDPEKVLEVQEIIDKENERVVGEYKRVASEVENLK